MRMPLFITIMLLTLSGCGLSGNSLSNLWFYTYSEGAAEARDSALNPSCFLELRKDGSYTRDFGHFEYGSWIRKDQQLILTDQDHGTTAIPMNLSKPKELQLTLRNGLKADFESQPLPGKKAEEDPFSVENNRWRIPATHKESEAEIRKRLYSHCRFWETYFTWALDNELATIDVRSTPTAIKIYGNGFGLKPFEELPAVWKSYFYDAADCERANEIIKDIFHTRNIAWAHSDNKYKMFIGAFQQLETFLK